MYEYIIGTVKDIKSTSIVLDNNGIGYLIYVSSPYSFDVDAEYKVYLYQQIREDENSLYGFKSIEEKELFEQLTSVKGLGCKMAMPILATGSINGIKDAIERENVLYLKKFPKIGDKVARQIILDLKGKLIQKEEPASLRVHSELSDALKGLGYKQADINKVLPMINKDTIEEEIKEALRLLLK